MGAKLFHEDRRTDGRTDMAKLIVTFRNFANAPKDKVRSKKDPAHHRTLYLQTGRSNRAITTTRTRKLRKQRSCIQQSVTANSR